MMASENGVNPGRGGPRKKSESERVTGEKSE